jgi:hypothetical protein
MPGVLWNVVKLTIEGYQHRSSHQYLGQLLVQYQLESLEEERQQLVLVTMQLGLAPRALELA